MTQPYILLRKTLLAAVVLVCVFSSIIVAQGESNECPKIEITSDKGMFPPKQKSSVKAHITGSLPEKSYLIWGTSVGKVVSGHGTSKVELFFEKVDQGHNVTIFLKIEGLPTSCSSTFSEQFAIASLPIGEPVDRYPDQSPNEVKARVDNFFIRLNADDTYPGVIQIFFSTKDSDAKKLQMLGKIFRAIKFRSYDVSKVSFLIDETPGQTEFTFWLVPPGADLPGDRDKSSLIGGLDVMKNPRKALPKYTCLCK